MSFEEDMNVGVNLGTFLTKCAKVIGIIARNIAKYQNIKNVKKLLGDEFEKENGVVNFIFKNILESKEFPEENIEWWEYVGLFINFYRINMFEETQFRIELVDFILSEFKRNEDQPFNGQLISMLWGVINLLICLTGVNFIELNPGEEKTHKNILLNALIMLCISSPLEELVTGNGNGNEVETWNQVKLFFTKYNLEIIELVKMGETFSKKMSDLLKSGKGILIRKVTDLIILKKNTPNSKDLDIYRDFYHKVVATIQRRRRENLGILFTGNLLDSSRPFLRNPFQVAPNVAPKVLLPVDSALLKIKKPKTPSQKPLNPLDALAPMNLSAKPPSVTPDKSLTSVDLDNLPIAHLRYGIRRRPRGRPPTKKRKI